MNLLKHRSMRFYFVFFLILTMAIGGSAIAAFADSGTGATVAVNSGSLSETGPSSVSANAVTLNGNDQTATYTMGLSVNDDTGSFAGWNLTITSTQFATGLNCTGHTLDASASLITGVSTAHNGSGTYTDPSNSVGYSLGVPAGCPSAPTPVKFFNAAANSGMGHFTITPAVSIAIPANAYAGTYSSTVTVAVVSGP